MYLLDIAPVDEYYAPSAVGEFSVLPVLLIGAAVVAVAVVAAVLIIKVIKKKK